jgi:hypothetical protein
MVPRARRVVGDVDVTWLVVGATMIADDALDRGREFFRQQAWNGAYTELSTADRTNGRAAVASVS